MRSMQLQMIAMIGVAEWPPQCDDCQANRVERPAHGIVLDEAGRRSSVLLCRAHFAARPARRFYFPIPFSSLMGSQGPLWSEELADKSWIRLHDLRAVKALEEAARENSERQQAHSDDSWPTV